jgi:hypothetical protein
MIGQEYTKKAIIGRNYAMLIGAFFVRPWGIAVFIKTIASST